MVNNKDDIFFDPVIQQNIENYVALTPPAGTQLSPAQQQAIQEQRAAITADVDKRLAQKPADPKAQYSGSNFYRQAGDYQKAEESASKAVVLAEKQGNAPLAASAMVSRGLSRILRERSPKAYEAANKDGCGALKLDPKSRPALELCSYTDHYSYIDSKSQNAVQEDIEANQELSRRLSALQNHGLTHSIEEWADRCDQDQTPLCQAEAATQESLHKKDYASALPRAEAAMSLGAPDAMAYFQRGWARWKLKDHDGAILDATQAITRGWMDDALFLMRADALLNAKRYAAAFRDASMAIALNPKQPQPFYIRGLSKMHLGFSAAQAREDFRAAARLDPNYDWALAEFEKTAATAGGTPKNDAPAAPQSSAGKPSPTGAPAPGADIPSGQGVKYILFGAGAALALIGLLAWAASRRRPSLPMEADAPSNDQGMGRAEKPSRAPQPPPQDNALDGRYQIIREIGRGGMGAVYEAKDRHVAGRLVAVKEPLAAFSKVPGFFERIEAEARALAALAGHGGIVQIIDVVRAPQNIYLILELVDGKTLDALIAESPGRRLAPPQVLRVMYQACRALEFAHKKRVLHRDLKPSNIMLTREEGAVKVMDFGIACALKETYQRTTGTTCGTIDYMAPEHMVGKACAQSDVYSLGICAYEMLTGRRPFAGLAQLDIKLKSLYEPATKLVPGLPSELDDFFRKALEPDAARRLQSPKELFAALGPPLESKAFS